MPLGLVDMMFDTISSNPTDALLELERIAVGPYCVFDNFKPIQEPQIKPPLGSPDFRKAMEDPTVGSDFPFNPTMRNQWLTTSADDLIIPPQAVDNFTQGGSWDDFMRWDGSMPGQSLTPLNTQIKQDNTIYNRRQNEQLPNGSSAIPTSAVSQTSNTAFMFGDNSDAASNFQFSAPVSASPKPEGAASYFENTPLWDNTPQYESAESSVFSPISAAERQKARSVPAARTASASHQQTPESPLVQTSGSSAQSSPDPNPSAEGTKKRKMSEQDDDNSEDKASGKMPVKKTAHNMIEKRYRNNLNDKIAALRDSVPSLRSASRAQNTNGDDDDDGEDLEGLTPAHKLNKATVLSKATEYIRHLEKRNKHLQNQVNALTARLQEFDKLPISAPLTMANAISTPDGMHFQDDPFGPPVPQSSQAPPQGMIPVPESLANLHRNMHAQQHFSQPPGYPVYARAGVPHQQQQQPMINRRGNGIMNKLMVGSLAGLMLMEGWSQRESNMEDRGSRGLLALPLNVFSALTRPVAISGGSSSVTLLPLLKVFLALATILHIISPMIDFTPKPKKKKSMPPVRLSPAPSLASPVEVRHAAWLTAIQTVWVPRHSFLLEAAALGLKTLKLSTRKLIGWPGYALLTGTTKDEEAARVKAWDIALDAQLTGGDAEVSVSRLVLTLMASGTLPASPARLMLRALHIRVLLWEVANAGYGTWFMFEELSAKLARSYWNAAREEHRMVMNSSTKDEKLSEKLPPHLAALLELECDDVIVNPIVQRAYNLAWNKPSGENTQIDKTMDSVAEDVAISSPLDALAAWWSCLSLGKALTASLASDDLKLEQRVKDNLLLAKCTAPPTSKAHVRVLAAHAVLLENHDDREDSIFEALNTLPASLTPIQSPTSEMIVTPAHRMKSFDDAPVASDIRNTLTIAKCLSLAKSGELEPKAIARVVTIVRNMFLLESEITLLGFVAAYRLMLTFISDEELFSATKPGLERISSSLRMWIGRVAGAKCNVPSKIRTRIVEKCVDVSKMLVGMTDEADEGDAGYVSQSEHDIELKN